MTFHNLSVAHGDSWNPPYHISIQILGWFFAVLLTFETILGNALVLAAYFINTGISKQFNNRFILSLAISDLIIGIEGFPLFTIYVINGDRWPLGAIACETWLFLDYTLCLVSILTVLLITIDRYMSVCHTARYMRWQSGAKIQLMIFGSWVIPALVFGMMIYGWKWISGNSEEGHSNGECYAPFLSNPYVNMGMYMAYYWTTLIAMLILYQGIHRAAKKLEKKGKAKETRQIALLLTQRLGTQVGVGLVINAQKSNEEATTVVQNGVKDSGYNTNNTLSTNQSDAVERRRWSSCCERQANDMPLTAESIEIERAFLPRKPVSVDNGRREKLPLQSIPITIDQNNTEFVNSTAKNEVNAQAKSFQDSFSMNSFAEGSIDSVFRLVSDAQFTNYSDDITASDSTSLIIVRNSSKHGGRQFSSLKSKRTALEEGILPHTNSRSLRDHRRHNHSSRLKKLNESLEPDFLPETILEAAEIEKNSVKKVSNMSADTGPKLLGRSRTLCVARETRSKKGSLISHRSLLPEVQVTVEVESPRRNWFERFIFWAFGLGNLLNNATSEGTTKVSKSSQQTARSFSISSSSSSSNEDESKKDANPIPVPKVTVTSEEGLHKGSTDTTASDVSFRMRSSSGTGKDFAHGNGSDGTKRQSAVRSSGDRLLHTLLTSSINILNRRRKRTKAEKRAQKAFRTITFIVGLFAILWSPYFMMATIYGFCKGECISPFIYNLSYYMCYLNSSGNPFMYALANNQFRSTFLRILKGNFKTL